MITGIKNIGISAGCSGVGVGTAATRNIVFYIPPIQPAAGYNNGDAVKFCAMSRL